MPTKETERTYRGIESDTCEALCVVAPEFNLMGLTAEAFDCSRDRTFRVRVTLVNPYDSVIESVVPFEYAKARFLIRDQGAARALLASILIGMEGVPDNVRDAADAFRITWRKQLRHHFRVSQAVAEWFSFTEVE